MGARFSLSWSLSASSSVFMALKRGHYDSLNLNVVSYWLDLITGPGLDDVADLTLIDIDEWEVEVVGGKSQPAIAMASTSSLSWIFSLGPWGPLSSTEETEKRLSDQLFGLLLYSVVSDSLSVSLCQINSFPANLLPRRALRVEDTRRLSAFRSVFMALKRGHLIN